MHKRLLSILVVFVLSASTTVAQRPISTCQRKDRAAFSEIVRVLNNLIICGTVPHCPSSSDSEVHPLPVGPKKHVITFWSGTSRTEPVFNIAEQDKLLADAKAVTRRYQPKKCTNGKAKTLVRYEFETYRNGPQYQIGVRVTYACCSAAGAH